MQFTIGLRNVLAPVIALLLLVTGCSSNSRQPTRAAAEGRVNCPMGHTLTCEVRYTGRIHHGSFGRSKNRCACVREGFELPPSPVIPRL